MEERGWLAPTLDIKKGIQAYEKEQLCLRPEFSLEKTDRIDRVGFPSPTNFDVRHSESWVGADRQPNHFEAVMSRCEAAVRFMGWVAGGEKKNLIQP